MKCYGLYAWVMVLLAPGMLQGGAQRTFGDHLCEEEDYLRAVGEYKRMIFFAADAGSLHYFQYRIGECYRLMGDYSRARMWYDKVLLEKCSDEQLNRRVVICSAICLINGGDTEYARIMLKDIETRGVPHDSLTYLIGVSLLKERRFAEANDAFKSIRSPELRFSADALLDSTSRRKLKSPRTALLLSTFLPGAGQLYAGRPAKGIISFSLNAILGYLTYKAFAENRELDGALIVYFGLQRFYFGNLEQARRYTAEYNSNLEERIRIE